MSEAYRCDRCGDYDDGRPVMRVTMEPVTGTSGTQKHELCPPCLSDLCTFMQIYQNEEGEKDA